jgi:ACS family hexuronate transporter-like MFS transporter
MRARRLGPAVDDIAPATISISNESRRVMAEGRSGLQRIARLRWWFVALICAGTVANYLARNSLGVLAPQLKTSLAMTTQQYSYVVGAFQAAYTVMQPVAGFIVDRVGLRTGFALFGVAWSIASMLHALAGGWIGLALFRGLLGASEAAAIPSGVKAIAEWFPARQRSVAVGWFNAGTSLGALLAPPVVVAVTLWADWRVAFIVTGAVGLIWAAAWYALYRSPAAYPGLTPAERATIPAARAQGAARRAGAREILGTRKFWAIAVPRFLAEPAWQTFSFWIPLYLATERGMDLKQIAMFAWLPFLAADLGGVFGGYLSPLLVSRFRLPLIASRVTGISMAAVLMIAPGCIGLAASPYTAIALFCVGGFAHQMISVLINTLSADVFSPEEVGTANGFIGQAGWVGGLLFSLLIGQFADTIGYAPLFAALSFFDVIGAVVLIASMKSLVAAESRL